MDWDEAKYIPLTAFAKAVGLNVVLPPTNGLRDVTSGSISVSVRWTCRKPSKDYCWCVGLTNVSDGNFGNYNSNCIRNCCIQLLLSTRIRFNYGLVPVCKSMNKVAKNYTLCPGKYVVAIIQKPSLTFLPCFFLLFFCSYSVGLVWNSR